MEDCSSINAKISLTGRSKQATEPTPNTPQQIDNTTENVSITVCNKNVANLEIVDAQFRVNTEKINNNTFKVTKTTADGTAYAQVEMYLQKNKQYTAFVKTEGENTENTRIALCKDYNGVGYINGSVKDFYTFTTDQKRLVVLLYPNTEENLQNLETTFKIMIVEGNNTQQNFVDNEQRTIIFPLTEGQKLYKSDYLTGDGIHNNRIQSILDGTESISIFTYGNHVKTTIFKIAKNITKKDNVIKLCSHFKVLDNTTSTLNKDENWIMNDSTGTVYVCIENTIANTVETFKQWLSEQKVVIEYELATEIVEEYTEEQQQAYNSMQKVKPYKTVTNIFTDSVANIKFDYYKDLASVINNLSKQLIQK